MGVSQGLPVCLPPGPINLKLSFTNSYSSIIVRIPYAQPAQIPPYETELRVKLDDSNGLYCCGDHRSTATLNGAIDSGDTVARLILSSHSRLSGKLEDRL